MLSKSGIYQIRNTVNGKIYVGSAVVFKKRWRSHRDCLNRGKHHSRHLQSAWNKHGAEVFVFEPIITCAPSMLLFYEQQFLDKLKPEYNILPKAGSALGMVHSVESKLKMRAAKLANPVVLSPEGARIKREKLIANNKARVLSSESRATFSRVKREHHKVARYTANGKTLTLLEWSTVLGVSKGGLINRLKWGWPLDEVFAVPSQLVCTKDVRTAAKVAGISSSFLRHRLYSGWDMETACGKPSQKAPIEINGVSKTKAEWAKEYGFSLTSINKRLREGMSLEEALTTPKRHTGGVKGK